MKCNEIMTKDVQWVSPDETVAGAAKLMAFHNLGFLPICKPSGEPIGVITDRDIALRVVGENRNTQVTKVNEVMSLPVRFARLDTPLDRLGEIMTTEGISRLLILDEAGQLRGIVSASDLLVHAPAHLSLETVRGIYARETADRRVGEPHKARKPTLEFFHGPRAPLIETTEPSSVENSARLESDNVAHGGTNTLKEFPV